MRTAPVESHSRDNRPQVATSWWTNPVVIGVLVYLIAAGALSIRPSIAAWAFAPWADLTPTVRIILICVGAIVCIPLAARAIDSIVNRIARVPGMILLLVVLAIASFVYFRVRNYAIGDGYLILGYLRDWNLVWFFDQFTQLTSQLGDLLLIWIVGQNIMLPLGFEWADCYVVVGALSGLFGLWAIIRFSRFVATDRPSRLFVAFGCLTAGTVYMWFGHVESYTPSFVAGLWTCALAAEAMNDRGKLKWMWGAFVVAVLFHSISLCLLPMVIYVSLSSNMHKQLATLATPVVYAAAGFVIAGLGAVGSRFIGLKIFVPILPTSETAYAAFTGDHLLDMLNVLVRIAPLALIALALVWQKNLAKTVLLRRARTALAIVAAGTWYFVFWVDPTLGALRDWDLLAIASFPLTLWAVTVLAGHLESQKRAMPVWCAVAILAFVHIGVLVAGNRDAAQGAASMERLLRDDVHLSGRYYKGTRLIPWGTTLLRAIDREDLSIEYFRRRAVAEPGDVTAWRNMGWAYYLMGDASSARRSLESALRLDSTNTSVQSYLGLASMMLGDWAGARDAFARRVSFLPWDVESLYGAGLSCAYLGEDSLAGEHLANAIGLTIAQRHSPKLSDRDSLLSYTSALAKSYEDKRLALHRLIVYSQLNLLTNEKEQAVRAAEAAVGHSPDSPDARRQIALCMSLFHADTLAVQQWSWYRERRPDDAVGLLSLGISARRIGETELAIDCQTHAAESAPQFALPCLELAELYGAAGNAEKARQWAAEFERRSEDQE